MQRFIERERPRVTLWYHQALNMVVRSDGDPALERLYSRASGLPRKRLPAYNGTATSWQNSSFTGDSAFVVELPGGSLTPTGVRRHAGAVLSVARAVAPQRVVAKPIPFPPKRREEMRGYAQRHYGIDDWRLRSPKVIVQHYTVTDTFQPVYDYFATDRPDPELGELPGVCAHYVIDRDGTVYGLVPTAIMCRHTVGLNWTAIGIEHVGQSDAQVMGNRRQRAASLRLTRMLQGRYLDSDEERDRAQREPGQPLPSRAGGAAAHPDARRLPRAGDEPLPPAARPAARAGQPALTQPDRGVAREQDAHVGQHAPEVPERSRDQPGLNPFCR